MLFLYNLLVQVTSLLLKFIALFKPKMKLFIDGRKQTFEKLNKIQVNDKVFWIHAASLGEFEQGRPIIERLKKEYPNHKIVVSFFSPSGYEIRKNYNIADVVCYLPLDTKKSIKKFIKQVHPEIAIIIKYEFWPNLLTQLKQTNTKTILVSGIFRENQAFFKWYGKWMQKYLSTFNHFFVQSKHTLVSGSSWQQDDELLVNYINNKASKEEKFIIAPHNIDIGKISNLQASILKKTILYSERNNVNLKDYQVLIIDTIGLLTKIYSYADVTYVGGGLATGLHNILEPATYGIPVIFGGNTYHKFQEANDLLKLGGSKIVITKEDFSTIVCDLKEDDKKRNIMGEICGNYVKDNIGATDLVMRHIKI